MKQLLIETFPIRVEKSVLLESISKNDGRLIIPNMVIQRSDTPNKNRRVYSRRILERETGKLIENVRKAGARGIIGELDHPESNIVNLRNACLGVLDYRWSGNDQLGDVEILHTPSGRILREIIEAGYIPGISSRGLGSVKQLYESDEPDLVEVEDDFELVCWDAVSDPSTHDAYFKTVQPKFGNTVNESVEQNIPYKKANLLMHDLICELSGVCCIK